MKRLFFILLSAVLCAGLVYSAYTLGVSLLGSQDAVSVFSQGSGINLALKITDESGIPIEGAKLSVAETSQNVFSDEEGHINISDLKEVRDERFNGILPKPWSEYTLIISKQGYLSYVVLNYALSAQYERTELEVIMFAEGTTDSDDAICLVDSPPRAWVDALVELY